MIETGYELIVTIVKRGWSSTIIAAAAAAGAPGATVMKAKGSGMGDMSSFFGIPVEAEKEVIFSAVPAEISVDVLEKISHCVPLNKPDTGISFILPIKGIVGLSQKPEVNDKDKGKGKDKDKKRQCK